MPDVTIGLTYFRSLALINLEAALYTVRRQDLSRVTRLIVLDNDTADDPREIQRVIDSLDFPINVQLFSFKHEDERKTHSWSTNRLMAEVQTPWLFFTRADYLLDFDTVKCFTDIIIDRGTEWDGFVTSNVYHLGVDVGVCQELSWRTQGVSVLRQLPGVENDHTIVDAGVWLTRRDAFDRVHGFDEVLTVWGHAQTLFQYKLYRSGVEFVRIPKPMFYHPMHSAPRDINLAHRQLQEAGGDLQELWARYHGEQPY